MGGSKADLKVFPDEVQDVMGYALDFAQQGKNMPMPSPSKALVEQECWRLSMTTMGIPTGRCTQ
jgi:hypothetical protein